jgi:hypothetical protein
VCGGWSFAMLDAKLLYSEHYLMCIISGYDIPT